MERIIRSLDEVWDSPFHFPLRNRQERLIAHQTAGKNLVCRRPQFEVRKHLMDLPFRVIRLYNQNLKPLPPFLDPPAPSQEYPAFNRSHLGRLFQLSSSPIHRVKPQCPELPGQFPECPIGNEFHGSILSVLFPGVKTTLDAPHSFWVPFVVILELFLN
jgi:hypothetical protein